MGQIHSCGFLSTEIVFEIERVREHARAQNGDAAGSHLSLVEKELLNMGIYCELGDTSDESQNLKNIKMNLSAKNWNIVEREALEFEKKIILKQAKNHNNGEDPLDVIPTRLWDALK